MKLTTYALLHAVWQGHLSADDAAEALGIPVRNVKTQVSYFGSRLEDITVVLDELLAKEYPSRQALAEAKKQAAERLGVSTRQVNRFLNRAGANPRPANIVNREKASALASERQRQKRQAAIEVLRGARDLHEAANLCGIHTRSMRRVLDSLPVPVRYPDYGLLSSSMRHALATNLERDESCDHLATLVTAQLNRKPGEKLPQMVAKPLISMMIAYLEGETTQTDPGFDHFYERYALKDVKLHFWEKLALADELRNLL